MMLSTLARHTHLGHYTQSDDGEGLRRHMRDESS